MSQAINHNCLVFTLVAELQISCYKIATLPSTHRDKASQLARPSTACKHHSYNLSGHNTRRHKLKQEAQLSEATVSVVETVKCILGSLKVIQNGTIRNIIYY